MKHWKISVSIGIIISIVAFLFSYSMLHGMLGMANGTLLYYLICILVCCIVLFYVKKKSNGFLSFKDGFLIGLVVITLGSILSQIYHFIYLKGISTIERDAIIDQVVESQLEMIDYMTIDELVFEDELRNQMSNMFEFNSLTIVGLMFSILFLTLCVLIIALIFKNEANPHDISKA